MTRRDGFSLLEVLAALVVFTIGVTGLLSALGHHLRDINQTKDHALAVRIAMREMDGLRRSTYAPDAETSGEAGRYEWLAEAWAMELDDLPGMDSDDESASDGTFPYQLEVTVSWSNDTGGERKNHVKLHGIGLFEDA
ncbi:Type II secretion system protein I [Pontiella desulfatans]|uniref:Type II secretion system protein I n=1 Tax=Pontiella desulfatans TaxID=2750659 RepID=A0A6C2U5H3_PONDE|nr:prepilin-type N-terminal cleavage/methylation domain-containing protein [Pontiella desulfatans]VGO15155.1 Type II secretion system protein I [Pontiella desulfatans]